MDVLDKKLLLIINSVKYKGLISAGDIHRAIILNKPLNALIMNIMRKSIQYAKSELITHQIILMVTNFLMVILIQQLLLMNL